VTQNRTPNASERPKAMSDAKRFHQHRACPSCGYDLYSLPREGNIVRCTECGEDVDIVEARRRILAGKLRATRLVLGACTASLAAATAVPLLAINRTPLLIATCALLLGVWVACIVVYVQRHRGLDGAAYVLVLWHISVGSLILGALLFALGWAQMIRGIAAGRSGNFSPSPAIGRWVSGMIGILAGAGLLAFGRRWYRRMYDRMVGMYDAQLE